MIDQLLTTSQPPVALSRYYAALSGCRFCPMCKVAGEVSNLTLLESHSTRARAMMLWRSRHELGLLSMRQVELLYQSTLDSISESWCIGHMPVSSYIAEARAAVFEAGLAPDTILAALERPMPEPAPMRAPVLLLAGESAESGDYEAARLAADALRRDQSYREIEVMVIANGALAYCLGDRSKARRQAELVVDRIVSAGATEVIADGPQTLWALLRIYPTIGITLPSDVTISSLSERLAEKGGVAIPAPSQNGNGELHRDAGHSKGALFLDSRSASLLADSMASSEAIQPGFQGPEAALGTGAIFEWPRRVIDSMGIRRIYSVWSRSLAKSCGADDGLWLTYPELAVKLARQRLQEAKQYQADLIVTDSLVSARHLSRNADSGDVLVRWLPELFMETLP